MNTIENILPVCSNCNKIRQVNEGNQVWINSEDYVIHDETVQISHGMCPDCIREFYPDMADEIIAESNKLRKKNG